MTPKEFLTDAAVAADRGEPTELSVREFIGHWNAKGRGSQVVRRIRSHLHRSKLVTEPDFRQVSLDTRIRLVAAPAPAPATAEQEDEDDREYGLTVGTLTAAGAGVVSVSPNASLQAAYTKMLVNDFSQLPVMSGERTVKGAVTWRSISTALLKSSTAILGDAVVDASSVKYSDDLLKLVPRIVAEDFVLVLRPGEQGGRNRHCG